MCHTSQKNSKRLIDSRFEFRFVKSKLSIKFNQTFQHKGLNIRITIGKSFYEFFCFASTLIAIKTKDCCQYGRKVDSSQRPFGSHYFSSFSLSKNTTNLSIKRTQYSQYKSIIIIKPDLLQAVLPVNLVLNLGDKIECTVYN